MNFLDHPPRFLFFTGKGGVGKTSIACASAVQLAEGGSRVLLVSTDPASNVGQVFGTHIGNRITAIKAVPNLFALEIDPQEAAQSYRDRIIEPLDLAINIVGALIRNRIKVRWREDDNACSDSDPRRPSYTAEGDIPGLIAGD